MGRQHPRAFSWRVIAASAALIVAGCGSISVVSDGGSSSGMGGSPAAGTGGHVGGTGMGGGVATGGSRGQGGAPGLGGATGQGGATTGTGGAPADAGVIDAPVDRSGCICQAIVQPVCGADGRTYTNGCEAQCAGVAVAHQGACVDAAVTCARVPGCCSVDSDCNGTAECTGVACGTNGRASGVCKQPPNRASGRCWTDADCPGAATCTGAIVCPCNAACLRPDTLGTCSA